MSKTLTRSDLSEAVYREVGLSRNESADLLYHLLVLLRASGVRLSEINQVLQDRHLKPQD